MKFREGDFIETKEKLIFDVKGLVHPPRKVIAFVRYIPDPKGDREKFGLKYKKIYELSERYEFLRKEYPQYLVYDNVFNEYLCEASFERIAFHYKPHEKVLELQKRSNLEDVERRSIEFVNFLSGSAEVPISNIGISGSILVGLFSKISDIDIIIYGINNCIAVYDGLKRLLNEGRSIKPYDPDFLSKLHEIRHKDTGVSLRDYVFNERRKSFQGFFKGRDFFVRYVKDWNDINEKYGETIYKTVGYSKIKAVVIDDSDAIFTPCTYSLDNVEVIEGEEYTPIREVASFRGRFCEQAKTGEKILAQGKLERVEGKGMSYYRLLLGNSVRDFMITINR